MKQTQFACLTSKILYHMYMFSTKPERDRLTVQSPTTPLDTIDRTSPRGWVVLMLCQLQLSSLRLSSFVLGVLLPFDDNAVLLSQVPMSDTLAI